MTKQEQDFLKLNDLWATNCEKYGANHPWSLKNQGDVLIALTLSHVEEMQGGK